MSTESIVDELYEHVKSLVIKEQSLTPDILIVKILPKVMKLVQNYPGLTGTEKKQTVLIIFDKILKEFTLDPSLESVVGFFRTFILPSAVDVIIDANKRKFVIDTGKSFFHKYCCCRN